MNIWVAKGMKDVHHRENTFTVFVKEYVWNLYVINTTTHWHHQIKIWETEALPYIYLGVHHTLR